MAASKYKSGETNKKPSAKCKETLDKLKQLSEVLSGCCIGTWELPPLNRRVDASDG